MAPFFPLYVRRSDGKLQAQVHGTVEPNEPTPDQLKQTPNASSIYDFYRLCKPDDPKALDWRRKLGGMLIREVGPNQSKDLAYILADLPENYRLYEHVKYKATGDSKEPAKVSKNHAAGSNERQDAYLYGYPSGRKKRYRSPNEFFPHLLWLATDPAGDPNNCSCKFCTPEEMEGDKERQNRATAAAEAAEAKNKAPALSRPSDVLKQPPKERKPSVQQPPQPLVTQLGRPVSAHTQNAARPQAKSTLEPTMLPRMRTMEQRLDLQPGKHLYRPGEVVWFKKGLAWGLGVIARRDNVPNQAAPYRIQPMSHPFHQPSTLDLPADQLRPWLAWSPPPTTCANLRPGPHNNFTHYGYGQVNWSPYIQGQFGPGDGEVDGSILAARQAESTYTPFDPISTNPIPNTPQPQTRETHFNGIFVGAEKIWVGDPLRLRYQIPTDIMVLHDIIEQPILNAPSYPTSPQSRIILSGDTFSLAVVQLEPQNVPSNDLHLPSRVRSELETKNKVTESNPEHQRRFKSFWKITAKNVRVGIEEIKGRWYESSMLLPILDPPAWSERQRRGDVKDACCYMNGQGDCNKSDERDPQRVIDPRTNALRHRPADVRFESRESVFGQAVPPDFKIHKGLDEGREGTRPGSSSNGTGTEWLDGSSRNSTRSGSAMSGAVGVASTPGTSPETLDMAGFGPEYGEQGGEKGDMPLFQEHTEGLGDVQ